TARLRQSFAGHVHTADDLLAQSDVMIEAFLDGADAVVLPPDVVDPAIAVGFERWHCDDVGYAIRVTAFDQAGMVPVQAARQGDPMRSVLPFEVRRMVDRAGSAARNTPGLDMFTGDDRGAVPVFPAHVSVPVTRFGDGDAPGDDQSTDDAADRDPGGQHGRDVSIGGVIATHGTGVFNLNTAPRALLERVFRGAQRGGLDLVLDAREEGRGVIMADLQEAIGGQRDLRGPSGFAVGSDAWAFRVDVTSGPVVRHWWSVYGRDEEGWRCLQRLVIDG
ncbi:MAG: hypothetical protein ACYTGR_12055, partial [Planctomycetota bacterium]